jgi:hypothetical protein
MEQPMKNILFLLLFIPLVAFSQKPSWVTGMGRDDGFPSTHYLMGFAINEGKETPLFIKTLKASAKSELIESIIVSVHSAKQLHTSEQHGEVSEDYIATTSSFADADINGLKIEYYYDNKAQTGYAFAYANKNEVKGYYKANISFLIQKVEVAIGNAVQMEQENKGRARKMYEKINPFFKELDFAQNLLIAIEGKENETQQIAKSLSLKADITNAIARLQSAVVVYMQSQEKNFDKTVHLLEPKLKAELSKQGCSFTSTREIADWLLTIDATTREGSEMEGIYIAFLDATITLVERKTNKEIYANNFTGLKGGGIDYEKAGRKAYDNGLQKITNEIIRSIEN